MTDKNIDYKALSTELDEILAKLQSSDLDVDESVALYERGMKITKDLDRYLQTAENKVRKIKADWEKDA